MVPAAPSVCTGGGSSVRWCIYMYGWTFGAQIKLSLKSLWETQGGQMPGQISAPLLEEEQTQHCQNHKKEKSKQAKTIGAPCSRCCCSCLPRDSIRVAEFWDLHSWHPGAQFPFVRERQSSFQPVQQDSFWNLLHGLKSSMKVAEFAERVRKVRCYSKDKDQTSKK